MKTLIGTSGWNYTEWKQKFYPEDIPKKEWFNHYTKFFTTVEINNTFYQWPKETVPTKWKNHAPKNFIFTLKAPQTITHRKRLKDPERYVNQLYKTSNALGTKMGAYLFQLRGDYKKTEEHTERLEKFLSILNERKENVIEFRNTSWWDKETYKLLKKYNTIFCIVAGLNMPKEMVRTHKTAYIRFHGERYATKYSSKELTSYAKDLKELGAQKIYVYFNNDVNAYAPHNAQELQRKLT